MVKLLYLLIAAVIGVAGFFFFLRNDQTVHLDFFFGAVDANLPLVLLLTLALGVVLGFLASLPLVLRMRRRNSGLQKRNDLATREIANLRSLPLRDAG